eukprot:7447749-Ditylum_brightwellii.AAC.1
MNLVQHHNLKMMMNHFAGQDQRWTGAMMTVITKQNKQNKTKRKKQRQQKQGKKSRKNKQPTKQTDDIPTQASPEVKWQHEKFIPGKGKRLHKVGGEEFHEKTPRKFNCPRRHSTRMQSRALKENRHYQQSSDLLLRKLPFQRL